ncbi:hypothetical protein ACV35O_35090, partial [Pseudomonas aeruginosa]
MRRKIPSTAALVSFESAALVKLSWRAADSKLT